MLPPFGGVPHPPLCLYLRVLCLVDRLRLLVRFMCLVERRCLLVRDFFKPKPIIYILIIYFIFISLALSL